MKRLSLAAASLLGLVGFAAPARADDVRVDFGFGFGGHSGRSRGGFFGIGFERPVRYVPAPRVIAQPAPFYPAYPARPTGPVFGAPSAWTEGPGRPDRCECEPRQEYIPAHVEYRNETVCVPAVYEDRCVPVYEDRCVPIFEEVCVPVYDVRRVPILEWVIDRHSGRRHQVVVGERAERVKVGERKEQVKVGDRHEQVEVGTRMERVLVRAETTRIVQREEWVPGRYVAVGGGGHDRHILAGDEGAGRGEYPRAPEYDERRDDGRFGGGGRFGGDRASPEEFDRARVEAEAAAAPAPAPAPRRSRH